ncbi:hypothetical protein M3Y98_01064700 [Aphelenchoides besseyi]|nr:hypothetical protein M3Y98_01064700 [Aphelenchoides besseyi]KAI6209668.1 hypothetical protein M3Y96_00245100 [Aphelenchoides besseyi]
MFINRQLLIGSIVLCQIIELSAVETPCSDQTQQCAIIVEEFERQIQDVKSLAFRNCFSQTPCIQERVVFDDCYLKSVRAVRSPFNGNNVPNDDFFDAAERYRAQLEQCFHGSEPTIPDASSLLIDEDAIYARAIYGTEFADRLWELQETVEKPTLDPQDACLVKGVGMRLFGGGISRVVDSAQTLINNLNSSCLFETEQLTCYRHFLDRDSQFRQMLKNRDRTLRTCIQGVRAQRRCRGGNSQRVRSCICNAREAFESRVKKAVLECARSSPLAQLYSAIVDLSGDAKENSGQSNGFRAYAAAPPRKTSSNGGTHSGSSKETSDPIRSTASDDAENSGSAMSISQGVVLNGQCLCACQGSTPPTLLSSSPNRQFSIDSSYSLPQVAAMPQTAPVSMETLQQQRLQQEWQRQQQQLQQQFIKQQQQLYQQALSNQHPASSSTMGMLTGPARSVEAGIGDGFERFFQGMPPIRRRDVSSSRRIQRF